MKLQDCWYRNLAKNTTLSQCTNIKSSLGLPNQIYPSGFVTECRTRLQNVPAITNQPTNFVGVLTLTDTQYTSVSKFRKWVYKATFRTHCRYNNPVQLRLTANFRNFWSEIQAGEQLSFFFF